MLLDKGYKRDQLIRDFKFAERTVDAAIKTYKEMGNEVAGDSDKGGMAGDTLKGNGKADGASGRDGALAIRKEKESILPEWLEGDVAEIFDGQTRDRRIFLAGMSVPLMGLRLFTEGVKPIIDLMATWQEGQARAARDAHESGMEMAKEAGEAAATGVGKFFMENKPWLATAPDPMKAMMADTMRPILQQVMGQVMGGFMRLAPMAGQSGASGNPQTSSSSVQQMSEEEIKEVFEDE